MSSGSEKENNKIGEITRALEGVFDEMVYMRDTIDVLESKLSPALGDVTDSSDVDEEKLEIAEDQKGGKVGPSNNRISNRLRSAKRILSFMRARLLKLHERLEL